MEFEDHEQEQEEEEEEMGMPASASYDALGNSSRARMASAAGDNANASAAAAAARRSGSCRYRECQKNHAVNIGGHAVDGCGEFMPAGEEGTLDALKCAACSCHRNFHRKEVEGEVFHHHQFPPYYRGPAGYLHMAPHNHRMQQPLALPSTSGGGGHSREDQEDVSNPNGGGGGGGSSGVGKKRFRTKFTQEQKEKMLAFAESLGWRIQKHDETAVQQFCTEACVKRKVLKVWMHNNKHTLAGCIIDDSVYFPVCKWILRLLRTCLHVGGNMGPMQCDPHCQAKMCKLPRDSSD